MRNLEEKSMKGIKDSIPETSHRTLPKSQNPIVQKQINCLSDLISEKPYSTLLGVYGLHSHTFFKFVT